MNFQEYKKRELEKSPELLEAYKSLEPEYEIIKQLVDARSEQHITQKDLAEKIGTRQSNISRLEGGNYNPSLNFLKRIAMGIGKELHIEFR